MVRCLCLLLVLFAHYSFGQASTVDSLNRLWPTVGSSEERAELLLHLAKASLSINPPQALAYAGEAQTLTADNDWGRRGDLYQIRGVATLSLGRLAEAAAILDSAAVMLETAGHSMKEINDNRCRAYYSLAVDFFYKEPQKTIVYTNKIFPLIDPESHVQYSVTYNLKASAYGSMLQYDSALMFLDSTLFYLQQVDDTLFAQSRTANVYTNKGNVYVYQRRYEQAAALFYRALELYDAIGMPEEKNDVLSNLSGIYNYLDDTEGALRSLHQSIALVRSRDVVDSTDLYASYYNMALVYLNESQWDTSLAILDEIIPYYQGRKMYEMLALCYIKKSRCYQQLKDIPRAVQYSERAAVLQEHFHSARTLREWRQLQAELYRETGQLEKSKQLHQLLIDSMESVDLVNRIQSLKSAIKTALLTDDFELAYRYTQQKEGLEDSLSASNNANNIRDLEIKYQTKEVKQQNEALKQEQKFSALKAAQNRRLLYLMAGLAILVIGLLLLLLQYNQVKNNAQKEELKFQLLRNQMNPHFLFNVLGAIQSFIYTNNPIKAGDFLSSFATLVRDILDNSTEEYVSVTKEVQWLKNYVALQALRFDENLTYAIEVDPKLQQQDYQIPPMLIQPVIENALEHGFKDIDYQGHLSIAMTLSEDIIKIVIEDNGVGFDPQEKHRENKKHISHATRITRERIALLNKRNVDNIHFETVSAPQKGTSVRFYIPLT